MESMFNSLYLPELREMLAENDSAGLAEFCTALHPGRTAEFMEGLSAEEAWHVLQHASIPRRAEIFGFIDHDKQIELIEQSDRNEVGELIAELPADDRVDIINQADPVIVDELLPLIPTEERRDILRLQGYPEETAGAVMTSEVAKLPETMTVRQALEALGQQSSELETIYYIYIVDDDDHLRGLVSCRQLVSKMRRPDTLLSDLMERDVVHVNVHDDQEEVARKVARYNLLAIPVVDDEHRLLGIITHDDVIDVMREEATEDAHRLSGVEPLMQGYLDTGLMRLTWSRGMWLVILFFGAMLTAFALQSYEEPINKFTWIVAFIPLVISCGGNTGTQSATLVITAMTTGNVSLSDWSSVVRRELVMGLCLGSFLGIIGFAVATFMAPNIYAALVIPITILLIVVAGTLTGATLPMVFRKMGLDPALMSNPFVAGIIDILGIIIYMNVALILLEDVV